MSVFYLNTLRFPDRNASRRRRSSGTRMTGVDAAWLRMDDPVNPMVITAVLWLRAPVDMGRLERVVRTRLVERFPRMRQRVVLGKGLARAPAWEQVPDFNLADHLQHHVLRTAGGEQALQEHIERLTSTQLDMTRPPWALYLLEDGGSHAVLLARLHHCIADGVALARVLLSLADADAAEGFSAEPPRSRQGRPCWARPLAMARAGLRMATTTSRLLLMRREPPSPFRGRITGHKRVAFSSPVPLEHVKAIGRATGSTVNDVAVTAVAGALRRYMVARGLEPRQVHAAMPVNLRPLDQPVPRELGNHFGLVLLSMPLEADTPLARLELLKRRMDELKRSPEALMTLGALRAAGLFHTGVRALLGFLDRRVSLVMTNVPGPRERLSLAGSRVERALFWVPQAAQVGLGVSLFSLAGTLSLGVAADAGCVPDPKTLVAAFQEELSALARASGLPPEQGRTRLGTWA
jgi:diacylglycerol O-acyltransferase / wax synthase